MILNLYCARDKVADKALCVFASTNDGMAIRENVVALSKVLPLGDLELNCIGTFDDVTMECVKSPARIVDWNSYKFPESPIKNETKEGGKK